MAPRTLPADERRTLIVKVKTSPRELRVMDAAARRRGWSRSRLIREGLRYVGAGG